MKKLDNRPQFSKNLIKFRKVKNLTQEELAEKTGLSKRMIAYYETEAVKPPIDKIEILANALNIGINDLLGTNETTTIQDEFATIDSRTLKKFKKILSLTREERHLVYTFVESLLLKREIKKDGK